MIYEINFIYLKQTKVGPLSYLSTQNGVALCDCVTHINEMVGNPSGLSYHRLPATPGDADAPLQGLPTSPPWTHFLREKSPSETTTKPGAVRL
jgi:hypothetical protein